MHSNYVLVLFAPLHPLVYLYLQTTHLSLYVRRKKLCIQYCLKLSSNPQNPTYNTVFNSKFKVSFEGKPHQIPPLGIWMQPDLHAVGFLRRNVLKCLIPATPPWVLKRPYIDYSIHQSFKDNTSPEIYRNKFFEFCDHYKDFSRLYTDGSKMGNQVAAATVVWTSCFRQTHLGRMCRLAGHSYKIFYSLFCCGAVSKCRQQYYY